jgi:predicted small lipoprotein YifL
MKKLLVIPALLLALAACGSKGQEPFKDAPKSDTVNSSPADIGRMPDGFSNYATKCDHGNRVYVIFKGDDNRGSIDVVPADPTC